MEMIPGDDKKIDSRNSEQYPHDGAFVSSTKHPEAGFHGSHASLHKGQAIMGDDNKTQTSLGKGGATQSMTYDAPMMPKGTGGYYSKPSK